MNSACQRQETLLKAPPGIRPLVQRESSQLSHLSFILWSLQLWKICSRSCLLFFVQSFQLVAAQKTALVPCHSEKWETSQPLAMIKRIFLEANMTKKDYKRVLLLFFLFLFLIFIFPCAKASGQRREGPFPHPSTF